MEDFNWQTIFTGLIGTLIGLIFPYLYEKLRPTRIYGKLWGFSIYLNIDAKFVNEMNLKSEKFHGVVYLFKISFTLNKNFNLKQISAKVNVKGKWHDGIIYYVDGQFNIAPNQFLQFENYLTQRNNYIKYINILVPSLKMIERNDIEVYSIILTFENYNKKKIDLRLNDFDLDHRNLIPENKKGN
jgi:hypothetical protein